MTIEPRSSRYRRRQINHLAPDGVLAKDRGFRLYWAWKSRRRWGRPAVGRDLRNLIRQMGRANPLWGAPRIHGELLKLGLTVSQATVSKYMLRLSFAKTLSARLIDLRSVWGLETLKTGRRPGVRVARCRPGGDTILGATQNDPEERCKQPA